MFYVYCPTHDAKVLLFHDQVRAIVNTGHGIVVHLECYDGTALVWDVAREGLSAVAGSPVPQTSAAQLPLPTDVRAAPACCLVGG
jgi:hypothetical protein